MSVNTRVAVRHIEEFRAAPRRAARYRPPGLILTTASGLILTTASGLILTTASGLILTTASGLILTTASGLILTTASQRPGRV